MILVTAPLWIWKGETAGSWHFLTIPGEQANEFRVEALATRRGFGSVRVEATIAGVTWRTSIFPTKSGDYLLPVKADVRKRAGIVPGDEVTVKLRL